MKWRVSVLLAGGLFAAMVDAAGRADEIYTSGPETLVARATQIVTGPIAGYAKRVTLTSEPPGPDAIPLKWTVSARVDHPRQLKGSTVGAVNFTRAEQSSFVTEPGEVPAWEREYGHLQESGHVVLFLASDPAVQVIKAMPTAEGQLDLASLVSDIATIQSRPEASRQDAWLGYVGSANTDQGRQAALRSLIQMNADWKRMRPALDRLLANSSSTGRMRAFAFGIVVFGLTNQKWQQDQAAVAEFLGYQFELARSSDSALQFILSMKLALGYTMEESARAAREPVRRLIVESLKRSEADASKVPAMAEQYRQIKATYPALF